MKYRMTDRLLALLIEKNTVKEEPKEPHKNQKIANYIARNFGCQTENVLGLVTLLGYELPEPERASRNHYPDRHTVGKIVACTAGHNYASGTNMICLWEGVGVGHAGYTKHIVGLGNTVYSDDLQPVTTEEEVRAIFEELQVFEGYASGDVGRLVDEGLVELVDEPVETKDEDESEDAQSEPATLEDD